MLSFIKKMKIENPSQALAKRCLSSHKSSDFHISFCHGAEHPAEFNCTKNTRVSATSTVEKV
jgi:hypothetical protein